MKEVNGDSYFKVHFLGICKKQFEFKFAKEFHLDIKHNTSLYTCDICDITTSGFTYFELIKHILDCHDQNPLLILDNLNIIMW